MTLGRSISWQVIIAHVVAVVVATVLTILALYHNLSRTSEKLDLEYHVALANALARQLTAADGSLTIVLTPELESHFSEGYGRYAFDVVDRDGHVLLRPSGILAPSQQFPFQPSVEPSHFSTAIGPRVYSGASVPISFAGRTVWVRSFENLSHPDALQDDLLSQFLPRIIWIALGAAACSIVIDWLLVRQAFKGLQDAAATAQALQPGAALAPWPWKGTPTEVAAFVGAIERAFTRLNSAYIAQRQFASDASHELRTPLAVLRMRIQTISDPAVRQAFARDIDAMTSTVTKFIELAELGTVSREVSETVDLAVVAEEIVERQAVMARSRDVSISLEVAASPAWVVGSVALASSAIRNVIDNAIRFSPAGACVDVTIQADRVLIADRGPGIPDEALTKVFDRAWHADRPGGGSKGLGLAIVQQIMDHLGGDAKVRARSGGGCAFELIFQPAGRGDAQA